MIAYRNGAPVRLKDVATVVSGAENTKLGAWANTTPAVILNVQRQPGANVIQVVNTIKALLPQLQATLPAAVDVAVLTDRTTTIRASVADVEFELGLSVALVVLVIFLFLRNLPATIIPSLSVPLSLVGTLAVMYLLGFSLDNLSLMALTISTGFVVDDAIVMIENIARYVEAGEAPLAAALKGAEQIGFTIISLTVSLIAVLIPLLFMGDVVGRLFHEFAITLSVTIIISAVVSLTLVPMMCARLVRHRREAERSRFDLAAERGFNWVIGRYDRSLTVVLDHQALTLLVAVVTLAVTVLLYVVVPKGFFPVQDTGIIQGISVAAQTTSYGAMAQHQQELAAAILKDPDVVSVSSFIGVDGSNTTLNSGRFLINLKPKDDRSLNATEIGRRLQQETAGVAGVSLYLQPVQDLTIDAAISRTQYQFVLENPNLSRVQRVGAETAGTAAPTARPDECRQRSPATGSDGEPGDRPGNRRALRHNAGNGGQRAVRPVRSTHHLDDLLRSPTSTASSWRRIRRCRPRWMRCRPSACHRPPRPPGRCRCPPSCRSSRSPAHCRSAISASSRRRRSHSTPARVRRWVPR